jgi:hypothetical protein
VTADGLTVNSGGDQEVYFGDNADGVALSNTGALSRLEFGGSQTTGGVAHFEYNRANGSTVFAQGTNGSETTRMQLANGGDISFYNSAGTSQDLYWDASSSRLGLGETNPSHELHIKSVSPQIRLEDSDGTNTYSDLQYNGVSLNIISRGGASSYGAITFARTDGTNTYNTAQINAAGDFRFYNNSGTAKMRWDASAEALGIGIETPAEELHISAAVPTIRLEDSDGTNQYLNIYESGGGANYLARNNTSYGTHNFYGYDGTTSTSFINITLDAVNQNTSAAWYIRNRVNGGSLNLGVETTASALYYPVAMSGTSNILVFNNATDEIARFLSNGNFGIGTDSAQSILEIQDANAQLTIDSELSQFSRVVHQHNGTSVWTTGTRSASDYHIFRESGSGNVIVDAGNVGIGTDSPNVHGWTKAVSLDASTSAGYELNQSGVKTGAFAMQGDGRVQMINFTANPLTFNTNGAERMRIDSSGNLLVGTTSTSPHTTSNGAEGGARISQGGMLGIGRNANPALHVNRITDDGLLAMWYRNGTNVGNISVTSTTTTYNTSSDQRLKDNIVDAPSASDDIDAIQVRSFDWKADGSHQKYGMVAQELQTVAPEAVTEGDTEEDMMGVDYSKLVPMLVKEIQSLRARVAQLEGAN